MLYRFLLGNVAFSAKRAAEREAAGLDASAPREYLVRQAGLQEGQSAAVFQVALEFEQQDRQDVAREQALVAAYRAEARQARAEGAPMPAFPVELAAIQQQRDADALAARAKIETLLGADGFESLEVYVHRTFGHAKHLRLPVPSGMAVPGGGQ
ncbi:MAG TPA: hypothetical protein VN690_09680 [Terriglobales bacterium]|nr:hypothetical protein [Terriglobales bacterium]